jgi:LuxR family maltose regulon positive regulatory protein
METPLLQTKLYIPPIRPEWVPRPRLIEQLNEGLRSGRKLTLVSAPAGFGKTTLVCDWLRQTNLPIAWFSLDEGDNDLTRFLTYLIAALQKVPANPSASSKQVPGQAALAMLRAAQSEPPPAEAILTALINEIATVPTTFILVLDDYHLIQAQPIHDALAFLLDHLPSNLHLVIVTRADPPLPIARLRGRGQLTELRQTDLRFTPKEAAEFLNRVMGLSLSAEDVAALEVRTEGWIVGLQLAGLSLQGRADSHEFVVAFSGGHHYVLEYLTEEVVRRQPEPVQRFLVQTSILDRLCGPLCNALTNDNDGEAMLAHLLRRNLFILPLDDEHYWYRYHHLFADLLNGHLRRFRPGDTSELHRRAAIWHEENGYAGRAVQHALAAQDYQLASRMIVNNWRRVFHQGWINTAVRWLESLPPNLVRRSPPLGIAYCWTLYVRGDYRISPYLEETIKAFEQLVQDGALPVGIQEYRIAAQQIELLRSVVARYQGDVATAIAHAEQVLPAIPEASQELGQSFVALAYGAYYLQMGHNCLATGDLEQAAEYFGRSSLHSRSGGNILAMAGAIFELAHIRQRQGRLSEAEAVCREALALAQQPEYADWPAFCMVHIALGSVLLELEHFNEAMEHLSLGLELGRRSGHVLYLAHGYLALARLHHTRRDASAARAAWQQAEQLAMTIDNPALRELVAASARELDHQAPLAQGLIEPLTEREQQVLRLICKGRSNQEIAEELVIALDTVKRHAANLYGKLGVQRRAQAILKARELGLI